MTKQFSHLMLAIAALMFPKSGLAFVLLSGPSEAKLAVSEDSPTVDMYWNGETVGIEDIEDYSDGRLVGQSDAAITQAIIQDAINIWNEVPGSFIQINLVVDSTVEVDSEDGRHVISVKELDTISTAAFASPEIEESEIIDCDITISKKTTNAQNLAYTIAHELGHCLGLGHPHSNYGAMMGYSRDHHDLTLGADDVAGLIYLYPDSEYGDGSVQNLSCASLQSGAQPNVMLLLLFFSPLLATIPLRLGRA